MTDKKKVVLITGAARGMGASHARVLAHQGWHVCVADIKGMDETVSAIAAAGGSASAHLLDVTDSSAWARLADEIRHSLGGLSGLVNNAGVSYRYGIQDTDDATWDRVVGINLAGPFYGMRAMAPLMRDSGGGSIVNISSVAGQIGYHGAAYGASKWGLRGLTKSAAAEYAPWNIRVNSVHPGLIDTPMVSNAEAFTGSCVKSTPMARAGTPEEVSAAVAFLISSESSYFTGSELTADGGLTAAGTYWRINHEAVNHSHGDA